jgi:hypothetical protein
MKKFYLSLSLLFIFFLSQAQINKGAVLLGGNLEYDAASSSSNVAGSIKTSFLNLNPTFGKAIQDNLVLGFDVTYGHSTGSQPQQFNQTSNEVGAGFFIRKYKLLGNGFYLFGQSRIGGYYLHSTSNDPGTQNSPSTIENGYNISLQFYPGIAYAINRKWQVEIGLPTFFAVNYDHSKGTDSNTGQPDQTFTSNSFDAVSSLSGTNEFSVGLRYVIDRPGARAQQSSSQSTTGSR